MLTYFLKIRKFKSAKYCSQIIKLLLEFEIVGNFGEFVNKFIHLSHFRLTKQELQSHKAKFHIYLLLGTENRISEA